MHLSKENMEFNFTDNLFFLNALRSSRFVVAIRTTKSTRLQVSKIPWRFQELFLLNVLSVNFATASFLRCLSLLLFVSLCTYRRKLVRHMLIQVPELYSLFKYFHMYLPKAVKQRGRKRMLNFFSTLK